MKTYSDVYRRASSELAKSGIQDADIDAWILFEYVFGISKSDYFLQLNKLAQESKTARYNELIEIRKTRKPVQYITGTQEFMGIPFYVNENVLIPRQDTETLVEKALEIVEPHTSVLDMCTGSGCIAISIANIGKCMNVTACDISNEALKIARQNADVNVVKVDFIQSDLFENIDGKFDLIISNPPYIRTDVIKELEPEVRQFEPMIALDGTGDGLFFYKKIIKESKNYLNDNGSLMFEIGFDQGQDVSRLMEDAGFEKVMIYKDLPGLDRVVTGIINPKK